MVAATGMAGGRGVVLVGGSAVGASAAVAVWNRRGAAGRGGVVITGGRLAGGKVADWKLLAGSVAVLVGGAASRGLTGGAGRKRGAGGGLYGVSVSSIGGTAMMGASAEGGGATWGSAGAARAAAAAERNSRSTSSGPGAATSSRVASALTGRLPKLRYFKPGVFMAAATRATSGSWPIKRANPCSKPGRRMPAKPLSRNPVFIVSQGIWPNLASAEARIAHRES
jgi:hypothetical protein